MKNSGPDTYTGQSLTRRLHRKFRTLHRDRWLMMHDSFIVIFCHVIQKHDHSDLNSLFDFVASLESCRTLSEGADKLYKMCHMFSQVAKLYLQVKTQDTTPQARATTNHSQPEYYTTADGTQLDLNAMTSFDPYLSALGLMPNSAWPMAAYSNEQTLENMDAFGHGQDMGGAMGPGAVATGFGPPVGNHNSVQDWFSGSRYLMNLMEGGDDLQMPDFEL